MASEEYGTGQCVNCGFLCKINKNAAASGCYEATAPDRHTGHCSEYQANLGWQWFAVSTIPWCFFNKTSYIQELSELGASVDEDAKVLDVIKKQRNCPSWYPWKEFVGPKEHYEEFKMQQLEQDRRKFELELFEMNKKIASNSNRTLIALAIGALIFAAAEVYATLASINPEHWLFNWLR